MHGFEGKEIFWFKKSDMISRRAIFGNCTGLTASIDEWWQLANLYQSHAFLNYEIEPASEVGTRINQALLRNFNVYLAKTNGPETFDYFVIAVKRG